MITSTNWSILYQMFVKKSTLVAQYLTTFPCCASHVCCAVNVPLPLTDTVQLPVNGPCKSRYLAKNLICSTVLSLNIQLYYCIVVFPRLYPITTYMRNTDYTDYADNRVVFIIWTDNVNAICATTISSNLQLWYCIAVFPRLYPSNTYLPNTDYTDNRVVFIIWTDNVNAICATTISSNRQLWYCIAVFPRLYPPNTFLANTDYTGYRVVFITWTENVNAICATTISSNIQLLYCIAVFPRLYPINTYLPNTDYTDYTGYRVVFNRRVCCRLSVCFISCGHGNQQTMLVN